MDLGSFLDGLVVKKLPTNAGDAGSIPWLGRSPGVGGQPMPVFLPENFMDRGALRATVHGVVKSWA